MKEIPGYLHESWCVLLRHGDCCGEDECDCNVAEILEFIQDEWKPVWEEEAKCSFCSTA